MFHDRASGRLGTSDVDVMLGTRRKAHKENTRPPCHLQQSSRQCLLEVPPSPFVFYDKFSDLSSSTCRRALSLSFLGFYAMELEEEVDQASGKNRMVG